MVPVEIKVGHYYVFHTQFDIYSCDIGRVTVNPFAVCRAVLGYNHNIELEFFHTRNLLPYAAARILAKILPEHLYDITDTYLKKPEKTLDVLKELRGQ